jgi:predicted regulator of Ras-like GTPase activity (Roadblock/LC7/MglB family)
VTDSSSKAGSTELARVLAEMNQQGNFAITVVTDRQGFPIAAAASPGQDPEIQSAVVALIQKTASQVRQQLGMAETDEISMFDAAGRRLVCRPFQANKYEMILAVLMLDKHQSYRRLTNQAISAIQQYWKL